MPEAIKGKYHIVREIARSNDIVYEAVDTTFGRKIAIKELNFAAGLTGQARRERIERFNREARAAGKLSHPNIVSVFDYGEENGRYFIAMEFLEGQSLRDVMQMRVNFPLREAVAIISQVLDALSYAHANKVVHRDIKPDNIHILPGGLAKLTDFGIARLGEEPALTSDGQVFGTPSYMSPEQIEGKSLDYRTDLFSTGVLLYEMLAGRKPFTGDSVISITYAIMHAEPPAIPGIPAGVEQVIRRALSKQAQMRHISAEQMKTDLIAAEQTPAMFLPQQGMGAQAQRTGLTFGYHGSSAPISQQPSYNPVSQPMAPPFSQQSMPPSQGAGGQLPWTWNTPGQPTGGGFQSSGIPNHPQPAPSPPGAGLPPAYAASAIPLPTRPPAPVITLSPAARTTLIALAVAIVLGVCIAFGVIATQNSYDKFQQSVKAENIAREMKQGASAYAAGDYQGAIAAFEKAQKEGPSVEQRSIISTNLAYSYVKQGRVEASAGHVSAAKQDYEAALNAMPDYPVAHQELANLLQQSGDTHGAQQHRDAAQGTGSDPAVGTSKAPPKELNISSPPPSSSYSPATTQDPNQFIDGQRQAARELIAEGDRLNANGDTAGARDKWTQAVSKAPGTVESDQASARLYGGGGDGSGN